jgi:hypothetical protein
LRWTLFTLLSVQYLVLATPIPALRDDTSSAAVSISSSLFSDGVDESSKTTSTSTKASSTAAAKAASAATASTKVLAFDTTDDGGLNTTFSILYFALVVILIFCTIVILVLGFCLSKRVKEVNRLKRQLAENDPNEHDKQVVENEDAVETIVEEDRAVSPMPTMRDSQASQTPPQRKLSTNTTASSTVP